MSDSPTHLPLYGPRRPRRPGPSLRELCDQIVRWELTVDEAAARLGVTTDEVRDRLDDLAKLARFPQGSWFDRQGQRIAFVEYARLSWASRQARPGSPDDYHRVAWTLLDDEMAASTVWTGSGDLDEDPPVIFETMIVGRRSDSQRDPIGPWRWSTEERAREGHEQCVHAYLTGSPYPEDDRDEL